LAPRLRATLEAGLADVAARVDGELVVTKGALAQLHQCERHYMAELEAGFSWSPLAARGTVAHKALELSMGLGDERAPGELVDLAIERLARDERSVSEFLNGATPVEQAELRVAATDMVAKFADEFPPLKKEWRPRVESSLAAELCGGRILLRGKVDLALGKAAGTTARVLVVDFKTGRPVPVHVEDLRFYALLETLRVGVPPFRVASWYLDSGTCHVEDVNEDVLEAAARRVVDAVCTLVELRVDKRAPTWRPCPACAYCPARAGCDGAAAWDEMRGEP
jgi:RecB family exonuclease